LYNILSVDWDFFLKCPIELRMKFEQETEDNEEWSAIYKKFKNLLSSTKINNDDCEFITNFINLQNCPDVYISNDHGILYDIITEKFDNEQDIDEEVASFNITNIDFHHDCYNSILGNTPLNCASWLSCLYLKHNYNIKSLWIGQDDSYDFEDTYFINKYDTDIKSIRNNKYDLIFICKSKEYMPPHLDLQFIEMVNRINKNKVYLEQGVLQNRWNRYKLSKKMNLQIPIYRAL